MTYCIYRDQADQWRWRLLDANNRSIANSGEGYWTEADCLASIELVKGSSAVPVYKQ
jgi:uncharacterized protein YegP (UPF0339 family)